MPKFTDIYKPRRIRLEAWAAEIMRSEIGQEAIRRGIASWLWDWCVKQRQPRLELPSSLLGQLGKRDAKWQQDMAQAAAGSPGPLTNDEVPTENAKRWANSYLGAEARKARLEADSLRARYAAGETLTPRF